ncbi:MAG TPA: M20/M25/M40 family metallo-hydrolase [Patescibacteria group bacterium]|jgi:succinyl-diaminopimelate desuccinylase|nr:M20/M25/M40 family metallo-hydrolase [Patescibacteria group bacterium]
MVSDLETLIQFAPVSTNPTAIAALLDFVQERLIRRGLHVTRIEHNHTYSLYASTTGKSHTRVLLQGHVDVVPNGQAFRRDGDRIYGRGSYDMLFAVSSYLRLIDELDDPSAHDIGLLLTGDEELGGLDGVGALMSKPHYTCDVCITPDAGDAFGDLSIAAKGIYQLIIEVTGRAHHGSRPWEGDGAAAKAARLVSILQDDFDTDDPTNSTLTVSYIEAGQVTALNQAPGTARIGLDVRFTDDVAYEHMATRIQSVCADFDAYILEQRRSEAFELDVENRFVSEFLEQYAQAIERQPQLSKAHGSSDARFFAAHGIPVIMLRPDGNGAHGDEEWLSLSSWEQFHRLLDGYVRSVSKITP